MNHTHTGNPVRVVALAITAVMHDVMTTGYRVKLQDGSEDSVTSEMAARHVPVPGDYLVTQEDGYKYVNPKAVFERKYSAALPGKQGMMGGATASAINPTEDDATERKIQAKGKTAPRVIPAQIKAAVRSCHFFTAAQGVDMCDPEMTDAAMPPELKLLTFCVLVLHNGFTVNGHSACASPENYDWEIGCDIARQNAEREIWPLLGFRLRDQLAAQQAHPDTLGMREENGYVKPRPTGTVESQDC